MGIFDGIEAKTMRYDSEYIEPGHYICRIDRVNAFLSPKDDIPNVVIGMTVMALITNIDQPNGAKSNMPGADVAVFYKKNKSFLSNVKTFIGKVMEIGDEHITAAACDAVCAESQPLAGYYVEVKARHKPYADKEKTGVFTAVSWLRRVPARELVNFMKKEDIAKYFPGNTMAARIEAEAGVA